MTHNASVSERKRARERAKREVSKDKARTEMRRRDERREKYTGCRGDAMRA